MDFIFDPSLVLYLPLHGLDGASFASKDACGHLCTVVGALWTPQGRYFDGNDDTVLSPINDTIFNLTQAFTLIAWYNPSAAPATAKRLLSVEGDAGGNQGICINVNQKQNGQGEAGAAAINFYGTDWRLAGASSLVSVGTWACLAGVYDRANLILYLNGIAQDTRANTEAVTQTSNIRARLASHPTLGLNCAGIIGDAFVYNRALSSLEVQRVYLATKWRYQ